MKKTSYFFGELRVIINWWKQLLHSLLNLCLFLFIDEVFHKYLLASNGMPYNFWCIGKQLVIGFPIVTSGSFLAAGNFKPQGTSGTVNWLSYPAPWQTSLFSCSDTAWYWVLFLILEHFTSVFFCVIIHNFWTLIFIILALMWCRIVIIISYKKLFVLIFLLFLR